VASDHQGPKPGQWYLLGNERVRVVAVGRRFATMVGKSGRRYVPLTDLADLNPMEPEPPTPPAAA
jgi:hypothetical protein